MQGTIHYLQCPVCKSTALQHVFNVKDYTVSHQHFEILECKSCSLRFTQDVPDQQSIGAYYKSEEYISHTNTSKGFINQLYQKVRKRTMMQKAAIIKQYTHLKAGRVLDIGCGIGTFLHTMKGQGWTVKGLEPDYDARKLAKEIYGLDIQPSHELFALEKKQFNAITMWHVLEHVHELHQYVAQLKELIADDGKIFIAVPNYTSKDAEVYKEFWAAYDVPRHLYHFSPQSMQQLMQLHGLKIIQHLPMWYDSFYVSMLSNKYKSGSTNFISPGLHGLSSNINAWGNVQECSSLIYIIEKEV